MKPLLAAIVAALAAAVLGTTEPSSAGPAQVAKAPAAVLGIAYRPFGRSTTGTLAWFDPMTLEKLPGRKAPLGAVLGSWAFSADRSILAIGSCGDTWMPRMRFVNAHVMRVLGDLRLPTGYECASSLAWLSPNRLLAVLTSSASSAVAVIDPMARRLLRLTKLPSAPWSTGVTGSELVVLFGGREEFVPARVAVVDAEGGVRTVTVDDIRIGTVVDYSKEDYRARTISPGFAVDPEGRRAFLVPASGRIAEIDLETLDVDYHEVDRPSLFGRLLRWLEPSAEAKLVEGPMRQATWLGNGLLAVSGVDYSFSKNSAGDLVETGKPVGVKIVDTGSWRSRMLSRGSSGFAVAPGLVIAQGGEWDAQRQRTIGPGIVAFGLDGAVRWRVASPNWIDPVGSYGIGYLWREEGRMDVIDLATGQILRALDRRGTASPWPQLLAAQSASW
jgi:hypothetical protein